MPHDTDPTTAQLAREVTELAEALRRWTDEALCDADAALDTGGAPSPALTLARDTLLAMAQARLQLRPEREAPYRDARMLLAENVDTFGELLRSHATNSDPTGWATLYAEHAVGNVSKLYPSLAEQLAEPERAQHVAAAIARRATGRMPWQQIAAAWCGIEAGGRDPEVWRSQWAAHTRRR